MDFKDQVKDTVDIAQVIGEVVRLRPRGPDRFIGLCPFHQEKSPSFNVDRGKQAFYCFGCHKGGDVFTFVQEIEGIGFFDALKSLAERHGIPIPKRTDLSDEQSRDRDALLAMQEIALRHFRTSITAEARRYLASRNVSASATDEFQIGYAPSGGVLGRFLQREGFSPQQLIASGLISQRDDGSLNDRFRNRLIFPIHNEQGKVIAFGGRALGDDEPKYLNSSDTKLYTKKRILFNLHRAKETIRRLDYTILVEGYMDVIGLAQAGVRNVVASCGTALSEDHVRALRRHSDRIVINFDPDNAGANAAERSIQMLLEESMKIRVLALDEGLDPDDYVAKYGVDVYRQKIDSAENYFHWLATRARARYDMRSVEGRMEAFRQMLKPALERVPDKLERLAVVNDLAQFLGVDAKAILDQVKQEQRMRPVNGAKRPSPAPTLSPNEKLLIRVMLEDPRQTTSIADRLGVVRSWRALPSARIIETALALAVSGVLTYEALAARLSELDRRLLATAAFADKTHTEVSAEQLYACVESFEKADSFQRLAEVREQVRALERAGRYEEALTLMREGLPERARGERT